MKNPDKLIIVGHRGAKGLALENTAPSIEAALSYGVDMVEVDLRVSKDGVVILLHDEDAVAINGVVVHPKECTYDQLLAYFPDMLTLEELLQLTNRRCRIMLECKVIDAVDPTVAILNKYFKGGWQQNDFMFASFKYNILKKFRAIMPGVDVVVLDSWSAVRATHRARKLNTIYLSMDQRYLWWGVICSLAKDYRLICYPNHKLGQTKHAKPHIWAKYGLYGVITDYPNFFLSKQKGILDKDARNIPSPRTTHR